LTLLTYLLSYFCPQGLAQCHLRGEPEERL